MTGGIERLLTEHLDTWTAAVETKSAAGRGSSKKLKLVGIAKLRELILELAVRGQLVPQDESDEPASVLLERIAAERERLIQEKKIKKPKVLPDISEGELYVLPFKWKWVYLNDLVSEMDAGWSPACKPEPSPSEEVWGVLKTTAVQTMDYRQEENKILPLEKDPKPQYEVKAGDILITRAGPKNRVGISCLVHETRPKLMISDKIIRFHLIQADLYERYISLCLNAGLTSHHLEKSKSGMAESQMNISQDKLKAAPIPMCPVPEQKRIVAKVDELMALCDALEREQVSSIAAHGLLVENFLAALMNAAGQGEFKQAWTRVAAHFDTLFTTEQSVEQLKQTILQLAVMGMLVEQDPADKPAGVLLERITAEKVRLVKEKVIKKQKALPEISEEEKAFELPEGWAWCRLGDLSISTEYGLSEKTSQGVAGIPVLAMGNIQNGSIYTTDNKVVPESTKGLPELYLKNRDVLYNRTNSPELVGKTGLFLGEDDVYTFASYLIRINLDKSTPLPEFVNINMMTPFFRQTQIVPHLKQQCGQANVNGTIMKSMIVPVAPEKEQQRIVDQVEKLSSICKLLTLKIAACKKIQTGLAGTLISEAMS